MIRLSAKPPESNVMKSRKVKAVLAKVKEKVESGQPLNPKDFPTYWRDKDVRSKIWVHHHGKCCYCERKRDKTREADIEHFRPKTETAEDGNPGYWWLAYDWDNLFYSCKACNQNKGSKFPLVEGRRANGPTDELSEEKPFLIHPIDEDPEDFIGYIWDSRPSPVEEVQPVGKGYYGRGEKRRGDMTIKILGLDRQDLTSEQNRAILLLEGIESKYKAAVLLSEYGRKYEKMMTRAIEEIHEVTSPNQEFAGIKRAFFRARGLGNLLSQE